MKLSRLLFPFSFLLALLVLLEEPVHAFSVVTRTSPAACTTSLSVLKKHHRVLTVLQVSRPMDELDNKKQKKALLRENKDQEIASLPMELLGLGVILSSLTGFILVNQFVGPWPLEVFNAMSPPSCQAAQQGGFRERK